MVDRWQKVQDNFAPALDLGPQEAGSGTPGDAPQRSKFARQVIRVAFYGLMWTVGFSINISGSLLAQRVKGPLTSLQVESIAVGAAFTGCIVMSAAMVADVFNFARENRAFTYGDVLGATFEQRIIAKTVKKIRPATTQRPGSYTQRPGMVEEVHVELVPAEQPQPELDGVGIPIVNEFAGSATQTTIEKGPQIKAGQGAHITSG